MARRLMFMLDAVGLEALQDTGIRGDRPRDSRLPDLGVAKDLPIDVADYSNLPGSDRTPERSHDDALVHLHRLTLSGTAPAYVRERALRLSELEAECKAKSESRP